MIFQVVIFVVSIFILTWLNARLIKDLTKVAKFFGIKEFIIAFFVLGISVQLPNFFVDVGAALRGLPQLAIGDMIGSNLVDLTLVLALGAFFARRHISTDSRIVQISAIFTFFVAIAPLVILVKGSVTRIDGVILIGIYFLYAIWMFSKDDRFKKEFKTRVKLSKFQLVVISLEAVAILALLFFVSQQIINFATLFAERLGTSLSLVGLLIVGLANCFPEMYLTIMAVRKGQNWLVLGDLMASVIGTATLVFGVVALVSPFEIEDISQLFVARIFLVIASLFFLYAVRTGKKITKREGVILLFIYIAFLLSAIFLKI